MGRKRWTAIILIVLITLLIGCSKTEKNPHGVIKVGDSTCYVIQLPDTDLSKYFNGVGVVAAGKFVVDDLTGEEITNTKVYYQKAEEGGYVAYIGKCDVVLYIPPTLNESDLGICCARLVMNLNNYMTISEASEYIPNLKGIGE